MTEARGFGRSLAEADGFARGLVGSAVLLLVGSGIERLFFGPGVFASFTLHPFWIVVLIAAVQNGVFVGVATVAMAALMLDWPPRPLGMDITEHYIRNAILPLQWLATALCVGLFRQTQIRAAAQQRHEIEHLAEINEALAQEVLRSDKLLRNFELEAVTQAQSDEPFDAIPAMAELCNARAFELDDRLEVMGPLLCGHPVSLLRATQGGYFEGRALPGQNPPLAWRHPLVMAALTRQEGEPASLTIDDRDYTVGAIRLAGVSRLSALLVVASQDDQARAGCAVLTSLVQAALQRDRNRARRSRLAEGEAYDYGKLEAGE